MPKLLKYAEARIAKLSRLLELGSVINDYAHVIDPAPFCPHRSEEDAEVLWTSIGDLTDELQECVQKEACYRPLKKALGYSRKPPPDDMVQVTALVAFCNSIAIHGNETIDSVALKVAPLFEKARHQGLLMARQTIASLLAKNVVKLDGANISLSGPLRFWMAGGNALAQWGLTANEMKFYGAVANRGKGAKVSSRDIAQRIKGIPLLTPQEIFDEIGRHGYISQDSARKTVGLAAYRHVNRLRLLHVDGVEKDMLPPRANILLMGETGTGKSLLIRTLFDHILKLPTAFCDATTVTEVGYVGEDVGLVLSKLLQAADGVREWGQCGISAIDEFDKIAACGVNRAVFGGAGTRNDVSRSGVQRGLLKIMEEDSVVDIPAVYGAPINRTPRIGFETGNVLFIACGAFTGIETVTKSKGRLGFASEEVQTPSNNETAALCAYGLKRELVARFGAIARLNPFSVEDLTAILQRNTISRFAYELSLKRIDLLVEQDVMQSIVGRALDRGTGARGLASEMGTILNDACFEAYSSSRPVKCIRLYRECGAVHWDIEHAHVSSPIPKKQTQEIDKETT